MNLRMMPEKLFGPEFYMEYEQKDIRLAVSKVNDFIETLGDASLSLVYSDKQEHPGVEERLLNIIRRTHIRHAIVDLNNAFDILLQIPWFLYRCWIEFNTGGRYCHTRHRANDDINRNMCDWIEKVENTCNYKDAIKFLYGSSDTKLNELASRYEYFNNTFRFNSSKKIVVREIANQLKHKHNIKLKEFYEPYDFNMTINGQELNLKGNNLSSEIRVEFYELESNIVQGEIIATYKMIWRLILNTILGKNFLEKTY